MKQIASFAFALCFLACRHKDSRPAFKTGYEGKPLPSFNILLSDSATTLNTDNIPKGKPVVVVFFSPQCPYCRAEVTDIIKNIQQLGDIRFYLLTNWKYDYFKSFYTYYKLDKYSNITAGIDTSNYFQSHFPAPGVPYTAIYDKEKKLSKAFVGRMSSAQIKDVAGIN